MSKPRIFALFIIPLLCLFFQPLYAQETSENSINSDYREIIMKHILDDVAQRQTAMQAKAESLLLQLPLERKLFDESEVLIKSRVASGTRSDGKPELNFVFEIHYTSKNIEGITDDYPTGSYRLEESNSAHALCDIARAMIDDQCSDLFAAGKQVTIRLASSTDAVDISHINYLGEYGEHRYEAALFNGEKVRLSLLRDAGITNNAELAFARAQGLRDYLSREVKSLQNTQNQYGYITRCFGEEGSQFRRCSIEVTVHGAFDETIIAMNNKLINDDFVEYNIPTITAGTNDNTFALIIANEQYDAPLPNCPYAWRDGAVVKDYCIRTLGIPERHIKMLNNASRNDIKNHGIQWLRDILTAMDGNANIIVYYSGLGFSDPIYKPYLLTCGLDNSKMKSWAGKSELNPDSPLGKRDLKYLLSNTLPLDTLCHWFNRIPADNITFIIDASFNGNQRNGEPLFTVKRSNERIKGMRVREDIVIFTGADVNHTAYAFEEQQHGFLTYYLLKELKRTKGDITYRTLFNNLLKQVSYESSLQGKLQEPIIVVGGKTKDTWENMRLR